MLRVDIGMKLTCEKCERRFYDLSKSPATCPICGSRNMRPAVLKRAPISRESKRKLSASKTPLPVQIAQIPEELIASQDNSIIEDTSDPDDDEGTLEETNAER